MPSSLSYGPGRYLSDRACKNEIQLNFLAENLSKKKPQFIPGKVAFLTSDHDSTTAAWIHSLKRYKVLHKHNVIL